MYIYKVTILSNNIERTDKFAVTQEDQILELVKKFINSECGGNGEILKIEKEEA